VSAPGETRREVARLLLEGLTRAEIARRLGLSRGTISYHAHRLSAPIHVACARRYDWDAVQAYYDEGHSVTECTEHFGMARATVTEAVRRGVLRTRPQATPIGELLSIGKRRGRWNLKRRLFEAGLKQDACEECGLREWLGQPLSMALHHVNGDNRDNRLENLRILCPNCHSQTENFSGRAARRNVIPLRPDGGAPSANPAS
jgi:transposase